MRIENERTKKNRNVECRTKNNTNIVTIQKVLLNPDYISIIMIVPIICVLLPATNTMRSDSRETEKMHL